MTSFSMVGFTMLIADVVRNSSIPVLVQSDLLLDGLPSQVKSPICPTPMVVLSETPTPRWAADHGYEPHLPMLFNP